MRYWRSILTALVSACLMLGLSAAYATPARADDSGLVSTSVHGVVTLDGKPTAGLHVKLFVSVGDRDFSFESVTDATGTYEFASGMEPGAMGVATLWVEPTDAQKDLFPQTTFGASEHNADGLKDVEAGKEYVWTLNVAKYLSVSKATLTGKAKVGHKLHAVVATELNKAVTGDTVAAQSVTPTVKVTYRWYRDGKAIKKATKSTYKLTSRDAKHKISVKVTANAKGCKAVTVKLVAKRVAR